ncbi:hypothetical protein SEVIR_3G156750v4 [Setaria viridis]
MGSRVLVTRERSGMGVAAEGKFWKDGARRKGNLQADRTVPLRTGRMRGRLGISWRRRHADPDACVRWTRVERGDSSAEARQATRSTRMRMRCRYLKPAVRRCIPVYPRFGIAWVLHILSSSPSPRQALVLPMSNPIPLRALCHNTSNRHE